MTDNLPAVNPQVLGKALSTATQRMALDSGDVPFLRLIKSGEWVYSADDVDVQDGSLWAVNPSSFMEGYVAWGEGELVDERMSLMTGVPIVASELPAVPEAKRGWEKQIGFQLYCLNGEDKGTQVIYKTSSKGGVKATRALINEVVNQINADPASIVPHIALLMDSYKHKTYGKIYYPVFEIKAWGTFEQSAPTEAEPVEDVPDTAQPEAATEAAPAPAQPERKRRRAIAS
jgi:hypothetical protein